MLLSNPLKGEGPGKRGEGVGSVGEGVAECKGVAKRAWLSVKVWPRGCVCVW